MARTEVDLANAALAYLVRDRLRNLDGSDLATVQMTGNLQTAIEDVCERFDWPECRAIGKLTKASVDAVGWAYAYVLPSDFIKLWRLGDQKAESIVPYARGMSTDLASDTQYIFTDYDEAYIRYSSNRTKIGRFGPVVFDLMALRLACLTCMPLGKEAKLHQYLETTFTKKLSAAQTLAANSEPEVVDLDFIPETIAVISS